MGKLNLFICKKCGKIIELMPGSHGCPTMCCGEPMQELKANSVDAAKEKHVPVIVKEGNKVTVSVGSVEHPMTEAHHIAYIILVTDKEVRRHDFVYTDRPVYTFTVGEDEKVLEAYEFCNLHGLWVAKAE